GVVIAASYWGKFKTVSQMILILLLIVDLGGIFATLETIFTYIALVLTVVSLIDYLYKNRAVMMEGSEKK
ncbi:MAG: CDP-diacylglycerol--glycerol-3-phosphate 3-phosphatidyltransferase, partial [Clostridiales bacterium]|nr:CDP-diacylglycerol--glycerol-3-phosphate 3-phosphatidyltransferase [Clostridiales bacterium]